MLNVELRAVFAQEGLGDGDFDVLVTLRRHGAPYELTPGELGASTMVTSSAVTKRIDRLERAGLVTRTVSQADARSRRIRLTDAGFDLVNRLMGHHIANEQRLVSGLSERDRAQLAAILRRWGQSLEDDPELNASAALERVRVRAGAAGLAAVEARDSGHVVVGELEVEQREVLLASARGASTSGR